MDSFVCRNSSPYWLRPRLRFFRTSGRRTNRPPDWRMSVARRGPLPCLPGGRPGRPGLVFARRSAIFALTARDESGVPRIWNTGGRQTLSQRRTSAPPVLARRQACEPRRRWPRGPRLQRGSFCYGSDDGGARLDQHHRIGAIDSGRTAGRCRRFASNPDEVVVAGRNGLWRSIDGGDSWSGLNDNLPALPVRRLLPVPGTGTEVRIQMAYGGEAVWSIGNPRDWRIADSSGLAAENGLKRSVAGLFPESEVTAAATAADLIYAGRPNGRILVSTDKGRTWRESPAIPGAQRDREDLGRRARRALRAGADPLGRRPARASDRERGRVLGRYYVRFAIRYRTRGNRGPANGRRLYCYRCWRFLYLHDPLAASPATPWTRLREEPAADVMLDSSGNQLYTALSGLGIYATMAPHRARDPRWSAQATGFCGPPRRVRC